MDSAYWESGAVAATCHRTCVNQKPTDELTILLFCDVHIDIGTTQNLLQSVLSVDVEPYRLTVQRHHWHCCNVAILSQYNQLRLTPSIP